MGEYGKPPPGRKPGRRPGPEGFLTNRPFGDPPGGLPVLGGILGGGEPSRYSRSPDLWNRLFRGLGIPGRFAAFDLPREDLVADFARAVLELPGFLDLTVTNPYKGAAFRCLDRLSVPVEAEAAVMDLGRLNHLLPDPEGGRAIALNTDGRGMVLALRKRMPLEGSRVLLVGAGDAGASIGYELVREGAELFIADIVPEASRALAAALDRFRRPGQEVSSGGWNMIERIAPRRDLVVSAVSSSSPLPPEKIETLPPDTVLADARYGEAAEFAAAARRVGRPCVDGREMLVGQFRLAAQAMGEVHGRDPARLAALLGEIERSFLGA